MNPEWAASWWLTRTTVRSASGSPSSQITFEVSRFGRNFRRVLDRGGKSVAMAAAPKAPSAAAVFRLPARAAIPPSTPAAVPMPIGHQ